MLVDREVQDYMFTGPYLEAGATWPTRLPATCAVETLQVTRNPDDLLFFENGHLQMGKGMSELADRAEQEHGWTLLLPLTPETGLLRQFVHVWAVQKGGTQSVAVLRRWLTKQPESKPASYRRRSLLLNRFVRASCASRTELMGEFADIGPYAITGVLGQGGMGVVYAGTRRDTGVRAAVKTVSTIKAEKISQIGERSKRSRGCATPA